MNNAIVTIMKKELTRFFGDKRMVLTTILLPGIMIYVMYTFMGSALSKQYGVDEDFVPKIAVVDCPESIQSAADTAELKVTQIKQDDLEQNKKKLQNKDIDLCVVFPEDFDQVVPAYDVTETQSAAPEVSIYYNTTSKDSKSAYDAMTALLDSYESSMANKFNINTADGTEYDVATEKDTVSSTFASMLPMLLLMFMYSGCIAIAPESIAGEKERGTIATLLVTPVKRSQIALGKITALSLIALLAGASSTIGTIASLPAMMGMEGEDISSNVYHITDYVMLGVVVLATILLLITMISIISAFAKTTKEAQTYVTPIMVVVMLIGITAMFGDGAKEQIYYYLVPVYNSVQCMISIFSFQTVPLHLLVCTVSNLIYAGVGVFVLTRMFGSEKIIFSK